MTDLRSIRDLMERARALARGLDLRTPRTDVYQLVLKQLDTIDIALRAGAKQGFAAARPLSILAVRELDDMTGDAGELGREIFRICDGLRQLAGLPIHD